MSQFAIGRYSWFCRIFFIQLSILVIVHDDDISTFVRWFNCHLMVIGQLVKCITFLFSKIAFISTSFNVLIYLDVRVKNAATFELMLGDGNLSDFFLTAKVFEDIVLVISPVWDNSNSKSI